MFPNLICLIDEYDERTPLKIIGFNCFEKTIKELSNPLDRITVTLFKPNQDNHEKCEITYPHKTEEQNYNCVIERVDNWLLNKKEHLQINLHKEHFRKSYIVLNLNDAGEYKEDELYFLTFSLTDENKPKLINLENYSYYIEYQPKFNTVLYNDNRQYGIHYPVTAYSEEKNRERFSSILKSQFIKHETLLISTSNKRLRAASIFFHKELMA